MCLLLLQIEYFSSVEEGGTRGLGWGFKYVYCECGQAPIIGLQPDSHYWVQVYVFNTAGKSSPSEKYQAATSLWRKFVFVHYLNSGFLWSIFMNNASVEYVLFLEKLGGNQGFV